MGMTETPWASGVLGEIPEGEIRLRGPGGALPEQHLRAQTAGRGLLEVYPVLPGIQAIYHTFQGSQVRFLHDRAPWCLEAYYCRAGRVGWSVRGEAWVYLGPGDGTVQTMDRCDDSTLTFPLGGAQGLSFSVDLRRLEAEGPDLLREAGVRPEPLREKFSRGAPVPLPAGRELEGIFMPLFGGDPARRLPYLKLKAQELLLYLSGLEPGGTRLAEYGAGQAERIREIHRLLTDHLDRRYTIGELSRRYLMNSSSLKELFKAVYGQPIATYMKEYRVHRAMELLRDTDESIADIAARVGYGTQGKFTQAFKDVAGTVPTAYRRRCRDR